VGNGQDAIDVAERLAPDLLLLDISMPEMGGLQVLRYLREHMPEILVVMLTVSDEDEDLIAAVQAGAHGYLLKNLTADIFLELIQGLSQGEAAMTGQTTARLLKGIGGQTKLVVKPAYGITARELDLLQLVARGYSNRAIAQELSISENTVKYHMKNILQKLHAQNRTEAVTQAIHAGILTPPGFQNE
jgi:DNA-binding NarL/FixJ family response regulator